MEAKLRQYREGAAFVRGVVDEPGEWLASTRVWEEPANLPTPEEIKAPADWVARVLGGLSVTGPDPAVAAVRTAVRAAVADLPADALVLVACSGGADSLALAAAPPSSDHACGLRTGAVIVDHGLQAGSGGVAERVRSQLAELALDPVVVETVRVGRSGGPEAAARDARYAALSARRRAARRSRRSCSGTRSTTRPRPSCWVWPAARAPAACPAWRDRSGRAAPTAARPRAATRLHGVCRAPWPDGRGRTRTTPIRASPGCGCATTCCPHWSDASGPASRSALARSARLLRDDADALDDWAGSGRRRDQRAGRRRAGRWPSWRSCRRAVRSRVLRKAAAAASARRRWRRAT